METAGNRNRTSFAAQWPASALPYRRFADNLAVASARSGSTGSLSFIVVDLPLLFPGLPGAPKVLIIPSKITQFRRKWLLADFNVSVMRHLFRRR